MQCEHIMSEAELRLIATCYKTCYNSMSKDEQQIAINFMKKYFELPTGNNNEHTHTH